MSKDFFERMKEATGVSLNDVQKEAVLHSEGALLLLASPGSGKTTTLNMKIGYLLLEKKVKADAIMAITFSRASAQDMSERFDRFFSNMTEEKVHFSTIHSFSFKVVREYFWKKKLKYQLIEGDISEEELEKDFNSEDDMPLHKKFILRNLFQKVNGEKPTDDEMDGLMTYISFVKNRMITGRELGTIKSDIKNVAKIYEEYEAFKTKDSDNTLLDFDDMLTYCYQILEEDEAIRTKYQNQFEYILTDESQDNSIVQHVIVEILAKPQNNICVVADDDQSIFMWRGSDVTKLLQFEEIYPNATVLTMSQNYRSSQEIVTTANQFIKRNKNRYEKEMFTHNDAVKPIEIKNLNRYEAQLQYVTEEIRKSDNHKEIAVLYRNNSSAIPLANELNRAGIEFYMKDIDTKFFRHWIIEDVLNFMRFSYSDKRVDILEKIHTKFNAYITKRQVQLLKQFQNGESVFDNLMTTNTVANYQERTIPKAKRTFERINKMNPQKAIVTIREELGYDNSIKKMCESLGFNAEHHLGILNMLENVAKGLETLKDFADRLVELENIIKNSKFNKRKEAITLTTFHSSKGLEYDKVYMIDLINGVVPSHDDIETYRNKVIEPMEEAVRLFYVGMTRARKHLELLTYNMKDGERVTTSIFVENVKQIVQPTDKKPLPKKGKKEVSTLTAENLLREKDMQLGERVLHGKFGIGLIVEVGGNTVGIKFDKVGFKTFMVDICIKNGLLQKATDKAIAEYQRA